MAETCPWGSLSLVISRKKYLMSASKPMWAETLKYLLSKESVGGVDIDTACIELSISRIAWRQRIAGLREVLESHPEFGHALPRATLDGGYRYRVTNLMVDIDNPTNDIRTGHIGDMGYALSLLRRIEFENEQAYDRAVHDEVGGKRSAKAKKLHARGGRIGALREEFEKDIAGLGGF